MEFLTRAFPERQGFLDLKDASSAELLRRVLQAETNFPDLREALAADSLNSVKSVSPYCRFCRRVRDMAIS